MYLWFNSLSEKADKAHAHDDRYYTESEIDNIVKPHAINVNRAFSTSQQSITYAQIMRKEIRVYIECSSVWLSRTVCVVPGSYSGFFISAGDPNYYAYGSIMLTSSGQVSFIISGIKGWSADAFVLSRIYF